MRNNIFICLLLLSGISISSTAQIKIGDNAGTINSNSLLELEGTSKGFPPARGALNNVNSVVPLTGTVPESTVLLPIELVSFNADYTAPFVSLTWVTESEIHSDSFIIERTSDNQSFQTVCQVKAAGQSTQTLNYQSRDMHPISGQSYYRLKQVDLDGTVSYSNLDPIEITTLAEQITVSPNPVTDGRITIKVLNHPGETLSISVLGIDGKSLFVSTNKLEEDLQSSIIVDKLDNLTQGLYIVRISGTSEIFTKKIVIYQN